jgi:hypothetical protein
MNMTVKRRKPVGKVISKELVSTFLDANPKDNIGSNKVPLDLVPAISIAEQSLAYLEGKLKYGEVNWRSAPVRASVYLGAALRHVEKFSEGEDRDPVTGVHHLANADACFGIIMDAAVYGTLVDDRKRSSPNAVKAIDELISRVQFLRKLFVDKNPVHFKINGEFTTDDLARMKNFFPTK